MGYHCTNLNKTVVIVPILLYMPRPIAIFLFIMIPALSFSQLSDMISVKKKNGRIIKTFVAGSFINFETTNNSFAEGYINIVRDDSLFLTTYDIRAVPTRWGFTVVDTIAQYRSEFGIGEISRIQVKKRQGFVRGALDNTLMLGGAGYFLLNIANSDYLSAPLDSRKSLQTLGISAGAFGAGFLLKKKLKDGRYTLKRHRIVYVRLR